MKKLSIILCVNVFLIFLFSCKTSGTDSAHNSGSNASGLGLVGATFPVIFTNYNYASSTNSFSEGKSVTTEIPELPLSRPPLDLYNTVIIPLPTAIKQELLDKNAIFLYLTDEGRVWNINAKPVLYVSAGCSAFALINQNSAGPVLFAIEGVSHIEDAIDSLYSSLTLISAGKLCVDTNGFLSQVTNETALDLSGTFNAKFASMLFDQADGPQDTTALALEGGLANAIGGAVGGISASVMKRVRNVGGGKIKSSSDQDLSEVFEPEVSFSDSSAAKTSASPKARKGLTRTLSERVLKRQRVEKKSDGSISTSGISIERPDYAGAKLGMSSDEYQRFMTKVQQELSALTPDDFEKMMVLDANGDFKVGNTVNLSMGKLTFLAKSTNLVYKLTLDHPSGMEIVIKKLPIDDPEFANEVAINHLFGNDPGFVGYYGYVTSGDSHFVMMEALQGTLEKKIKNYAGQSDVPFSNREDEFFNEMKLLAQNLIALQTVKDGSGIRVFGDFKTPNIGITKDARLVLFDFGSVRKVPTDKIHSFETINDLNISPHLQPPEVVANTPLGVVDPVKFWSDLHDRGVDAFKKYLSENSSKYPSLSAEDIKYLESNWDLFKSAGAMKTVTANSPDLAIAFRAYNTLEKKIDTELRQQKAIQNALGGAEFDANKIDPTGFSNVAYELLVRKDLESDSRGAGAFGTGSVPAVDMNNLDAFLDAKIKASSSQKEKAILALIKRAYGPAAQRPTVREFDAELDTIRNS